MMGVTPIRGFAAADQTFVGMRSTRANRVRAARSFFCSLGKPRAGRIPCAPGIPRHDAIVETRSHDSTPLLLRGKALNEHVYPRRNHERCAAAVVNDGIRFLSRRLRPPDGAAIEVGRLD